jgi:hypothetical protein
LITTSSTNEILSLMKKLCQAQKMIFFFAALLFSQSLFAQPTISSFSPASGPVGTTVTITGTGFAANVADNIVYFGSIKTAVLEATNTTLTVTVPKGASYKPISVTSNGLTAFSAQPFIVTFGPGTNPFGTTSFEHTANFPLDDSPFGACAGDFNGDAKPDLAFADFGLFANSVLSIYKNTGSNGTVGFATRADMAAASLPHDCGAGDFDGDGKLDLVSVNYGAGSVSVLRNTSANGNISFATANNLTIGAGSQPRMVSIADFDSDGKPDIAVTRFASNSITVFRNVSTVGNISFPSAVTYTTGSNPFSISVADCDGDNKPDLAVTNYESGSVSVFKNTSSTGNISFATKIDLSCGVNPRSICFADLDHSGLPEIIVANHGSNSISVLNNTSIAGSLSFAAKVDYTAGNNPTYVSAGDLDGDGKVDIAVANMSGNTVSIYKNTGTAASISLAGAVHIATGASPRCVVIQDINADSKPDLAVVNNHDKNFSVLLNKMEGTNTTDPPSITSFSPTAAGPYASILIRGANFNDVSAVTFGGIAADSFSVISPTVISAYVGLGASGNVAVTTPYGVGTLSGFIFNAPPAPAINSFTPDTATTATVVTITGTDFYGVTSVLFGGTPAASFVVESPTQILATVGTGSTGDVTVNTAFGTVAVSGFSYFAPPAITSFSPETGGKDMTVTITGTNLEHATQVSFGGVPASSFTIVNATTITAVVGNGASGSIEVITPGGTASKTGFTFIPPPQINSFTPVTAASGQTITIKGSNLSGATAVSFGGTAAASFTVVDAATIQAVVGTGSTGDVVITTPGGTATKTGFIFIPAPEIISFTPATATTGTVITITGSNFTGASEVRFGNVTAASFTVHSSTSITAEIGAGASGAVSITTPGGTASSSGFTYTIPPPPSITSFTPTTGTAGTIVTITGDHLKGTSHVWFGGVAADSIAIISQTTLKVVVGAGSTGDVSVTTPGGSDTVSGFTFNAPVAPTITSFSPKTGAVGTAVTITGTNFNPVAANNIVYFGAVRATVTSASSNSLTVLVPPGASYYPISVTTSRYTAWSNLPFIVKFVGIGDRFTASSFTLETDYAPGGEPYGIAVTDLDGDGKPDMAVAERVSGSVSIYRNTSTYNEISFAPKVNYLTGNNAVRVEAGDFNGDGKPDLVVANSLSMTVSVLKNQSTPGNISFATPVSVTPVYTGNQTWDLKIADLDGDGRPDLAAANYDGHVVSIFRNTSSSDNISFATKVDLPVNGSSNSLAISDIDGDGKSDIAVAINSATSVAIFRNTSVPGTLSFASAPDLTTDFAASAVAFGDLDGDDKPDLAVANYDNGNFSSYTVSVFRNVSSAGTISFEPKIDYAAGSFDFRVCISDLDGDGKPDLATANLTSYTISVLKNNSTAGSISFASRVDYPTGSFLNNFTVGDVSGDGKPELIAAIGNGFLSSVSILKNTIGEPAITPSGSNPVSEPVITKLTVDETVQTHNGFPYVQRHYDIEPVNNPETATATVTLYFTQQEFDNYNAHPAHGFNLPTNANDATGKANLRVYQYHGFSTTSQPGSYTGSGIEINPDDTKIIWNATNQWWEVTFDVTGFSGFFIGSVGNGVLPLKLLSFTGTLDGTSVHLKWETAEQINTAYFEVQRSIDGIHYVKLNQVTAAGNANANLWYHYTDLPGTDPVYYYRLKMVDIDNAFTYSNVIVVKPAKNNAGLVLYPNPSKGNTIVRHPLSNSYSEIKIIDMTGRVIKTIRGEKNAAQTSLNVVGISAGVYKIRWTDGIKVLNQTLIIE